MSDAQRRWTGVHWLATLAALGAAVVAIFLAARAFQWLESLDARQAEQGGLLMRMGAAAGQGAETPVWLPEDWSRGGKMAIRLCERPAALNPFLIQDAGARAVCDLVCETLARRDLDSLEFRPGLAASWDVSDDKLTYTFHLNPHAHFSDGQPVTAEDVVFTFEALRDERICGQACAALLADLQDVQATDLLTVRFRFARPYFLAFPAVADRYIVPKHVYASADAKRRGEAAARDLLVGSGPLVVEQPGFALGGGDIVLKRSEGYWDRARVAALDEIAFRPVEEDLRAFQLLKTGGLDVMHLSPEQFREVEADQDFLKYHRVFRYYSPELGSIGLGWNNARGPLADVRVRRAMSRLVPRQKIADEIYLGLARLVEAPFWSGGPQYPRDLAALAFDPQEAARLLDEAGWRLEGRQEVRQKGGAKLELELLVPKREERLRTIGDYLSREAEKVGVRVKLRRLSWAEMQERLAGRDFDAALLAWTGAVESDPFLFWHSSQRGRGGLNVVGFAQPEADRLTEAIRHELDGPARNRLCAELAQVLRDAQPCTMLLEPETVVAISARFAGVTRYRLGLRPQEWYIPRRFPAGR